MLTRAQQEGESEIDEVKWKGELVNKIVTEIQEEGRIWRMKG